MLLGAMLRTLERVVCAAAERPSTAPVDVRPYWTRPEVNRGREDWPVGPSRQFTALVNFFNAFGLGINVEVFGRRKLDAMIARWPGPKKPTSAEIWARYVCDAFAAQPGRKDIREILAHDYEFNLCLHALPSGRRTFNNVSAFIYGFMRALYPHSPLMRVVVRPTDHLDYVAFSVSIKPKCHYRMEFETTRDASIILRIWS